VITQRIRDALSLWTDDGLFALSIPFPAFAGNYVGNGDLDNPVTCPTLSPDPLDAGRSACSSNT